MSKSTCLYCKNELSPQYRCEHCPCRPQYWGRRLKSGDLEYVAVQFNIDDYIIELDFEDKICGLFLPKIWQSRGNKPIIKLNYLADITPVNAKEWLDKLLKIKVFS
jgi:hypothetical protein